MLANFEIPTLSSENLVIFKFEISTSNPADTAHEAKSQKVLDFTKINTKACARLSEHSLLGQRF